LVVMQQPVQNNARNAVPNFEANNSIGGIGSRQGGIPNVSYGFTIFLNFYAINLLFDCYL